MTGNIRSRKTIIEKLQFSSQDSLFCHLSYISEHFFTSGYEKTNLSHSELGSHLDDNVSFSGACAVKLTVFLHHHNLTLFFHLLHIFLYLVKDTAVILLCYANKLTEKARVSKKTQTVRGK